MGFDTGSDTPKNSETQKGDSKVPFGAQSAKVTQKLLISDSKATKVTFFTILVTLESLLTFESLWPEPQKLGGNFGPEKKKFTPPPQIPRKHPPGLAPPRAHPPGRPPPLLGSDFPPRRKNKKYPKRPPRKSLKNHFFLSVNFSGFRGP